MKKSVKALLITGAVILGIVVVFVILTALYFNDFRKEYRTSGNAIDRIVKEFQDRKIIAFGENHTRVNEQLFLANNLEALYNAGVRYIFIEGGDPESNIPSGETYFFIMWYPWSISGWRYETTALYQAIVDFNNTLQSDDKIKIISPEKIPPDNMTSRAQQWNFRDSSAAETIIEIMDAASDDTKAIIWYGAGHTNFYIFKNYYDSAFYEKFDWIPFGYLLKKHYGSDYSSYYFVTEHDKDRLINSKYLQDEAKLVALDNISFTKIPFLKDVLIRPTYLAGGYDGYHDGYIVEPSTVQGTFYQYNPTNANLSFLFKFVEDYVLECSPDNNYKPFESDNNIVLGVNSYKEYLGENFDYTSPNMNYMSYELHGQFMISLYYLKLYFGDKFDYAFWKTESSKGLLTALAELKNYAFANNVPSDYIKINYSRDTLRLYHRYMYSSDLILYNIQKMPGKDILEDYLLQARELFPEDLWSLYWLGFAATEKEQWEKGLKYFQELFEEDLAFCMESLPLAYQKAALCAEKSGNSRLAEEYNRTAGALYNDFNITVDKNTMSTVGYQNGSWLVSDL